LSRPFPSPRLTGICLVVAAALLELGYMLTPWESQNTTAAYHDALAEHATMAQAAATVLHFSWIVFVPAVFGIVALLRPRGGKLLAIGGTLAIVGTASMPGLLMSDFFDLAMAQELPRAVSVRVSESVGDFGLTALFILPAVFGANVGLVLLVFALWRADVVARWVPFTVLVGSLLTFALGAGVVSFAVGGGLTTIGLVASGLRLIRHDAVPMTVTAAPLATAS
jgi:hypothetical protein